MTVAFDREGIRINLGSIGKGYAIDRAIELIRNNVALRFGAGARRAVEPVCAGLAAGPVRLAAGKLRCGIRSSRNRRWACCGCGIGAWVPQAQPSSSLSSATRSMAISLTHGRESPPTDPRASLCWRLTAAMADALSTAFYPAGARGCRGIHGRSSRNRRGLCFGRRVPNSHRAFVAFGLSESDFVPANESVN